MSDDLVKRLRDWESVYAVDDDKPEGSLYIEAADRIEELEDKLAKAVEHVSDYSNDPHLVEWANATLAELKGDT